MPGNGLFWANFRVLPYCFRLSINRPHPLMYHCFDSFYGLFIGVTFIQRGIGHEPFDFFIQAFQFRPGHCVAFCAAFVYNHNLKRFAPVARPCGLYRLNFVFVICNVKCRQQIQLVKFCNQFFGFFFGFKYRVNRL